MPVRGQIPDTGISLNSKWQYQYPSYTMNMPVRVRYSVSLFNKSLSCRVTKLLTASGEMFGCGEFSRPASEKNIEAWYHTNNIHHLTREWYASRFFDRSCAKTSAARSFRLHLLNRCTAKT
jgi:hypothetical protein